MMGSHKQRDDDEGLLSSFLVRVYACLLLLDRKSVV